MAGPCCARQATELSWLVSSIFVVHSCHDFSGNANSSQHADSAAHLARSNVVEER